MQVLPFGKSYYMYNNKIQYEQIKEHLGVRHKNSSKIQRRQVSNFTGGCNDYNSWKQKQIESISWDFVYVIRFAGLPFTIVSINGWPVSSSLFESDEVKVVSPVVFLFNISVRN